MGFFRKKNMKYNILIAGLDNADALDKLETYIRENGKVRIDNFFKASGLEQLKSILSTRPVDVVFCTEVFKDKQRIGRGTIKAWKTEYPMLRPILIISDSMKGKLKLSRLYDDGYYDALFQSDASAGAFEECILNTIGRTKEEAFAYYGLENTDFNREEGAQAQISKPMPQAVNEEAQTPILSNPLPIKTNEVSYMNTSYSASYSPALDQKNPVFVPKQPAADAWNDVSMVQTPVVPTQPKASFENPSLQLAPQTTPIAPLQPPARTSNLRSVDCTASCVINNETIILTARSKTNFFEFSGRRAIVTFID